MSLKKLILPVCGLMIMCATTSYAQGYGICTYSDGTEWELSKVMEKKGHEMGFVKFCCDELGMCSNAYRNPNGEKLTHSAAKGKNYEALAYLVNEKKIAYDDFRRDPSTLKYVEDYTQLMHTAKNGDYTSTDYLLNKGANAAKINKDRNNALYFAELSKNQKVIGRVKTALGLAMNEINRTLQRRTAEVRTLAQNAPQNREDLLKELRNPKVYKDFKRITDSHNYLASARRV